MTVTINREDYFKLLQEIQIVPKVIETETEYEQNLAVAEKLIAKNMSLKLCEPLDSHLIFGVRQ